MRTHSHLPHGTHNRMTQGPRNLRLMNSPGLRAACVLAYLAVVFAATRHSHTQSPGHDDARPQDACAICAAVLNMASAPLPEASAISLDSRPVGFVSLTPQRDGSALVAVVVRARGPPGLHPRCYEG